MGSSFFIPKSETFISFCRIICLLLNWELSGKDSRWRHWRGYPKSLCKVLQQKVTNFLVSTYVVCDAQAGFWPNSKFWSKFSRPKFTLEYPPPHFGKLQIWDHQSLLRNTPPPISENFRFGITKVYSGIPPPFRKTSDLGSLKLLRNTPPPLENFRFGITKVYSGIPPFGKLQIWDHQSLLRNTPPPHFGKLQIWDHQSLLRNTPHFGKLQIWDDQSLLRNTPPPPPSESQSPRFSEYRELLHVETLSNPDNY